jgi:hypothetical protein
MVTLMQEYEWFPAYLKALTEVDPQKHLVAIDSALGVLVDRYELLQHDRTEERELLLRGIAILRDVRKEPVRDKTAEDGESSVSSLDALLRVATEKLRKGRAK